MATTMVRPRKNMKRLESRKSHSWWWDSHISPKNSKWLAENLEEMDDKIKRMVKLIEEDADSFAKKAEMYYQKRPELVSLVEEFYRMYRALAERYDLVTGELRKNIPADLQSQGSGFSDISSDAPASEPSSEQKLSRPKSGPRAAGFDKFLGSAGSTSDVSKKEGNESSSSSDSGSESDDSSVNNYSGAVRNGGGDQELNRRIAELENELREANERLRLKPEDNIDGPLGKVNSEDFMNFQAKIAAYGQELKDANTKIQNSEEEIARLKTELQKYTSSVITNGVHTAEFEPSEEQDLGTSKSELVDINCVVEGETQNTAGKIEALAEELKISKEKLQDAEKEINSLKRKLEVEEKASEKLQNLQQQLEVASQEVITWRNKLKAEKKEVLKLQERITMLKTSLSDRDNENRDLKLAVSDAERKIFPEKAQIKLEISKLLEEQTHLYEQIREWESHGRSLTNEKTEMENKLNGEIEKLKAEIGERDNGIEKLNKSINGLIADKNSLIEETVLLTAVVKDKDEKLTQLEQHLQQLHMEHVELIAKLDGARKLIDQLRGKAKELEDEVERQRVLILEGAEEKREVIRQLCFSLEHYRDGYIRLREAFVGHRRVAVAA